MTPHEPIEALQESLNYHFKQPRLLLEALTHSTYANECLDAGPNNERFEFLGDAVLDLITSDILLKQRPTADEGELSCRRAEVVCRDALAVQAKKTYIGLLHTSRSRAAWRRDRQ